MFGPGAQAGFQNALATGLQIGGIVRQQTDARNERNALAAYATDPNEANLKALAPYQPDFVLKQGQQQQAAQAETQLADLTTRFLGGDETAGDELARLNFDRWAKVDPLVKAKITEQTQVFGNAAIDLLNTPYEGRRGTIISFSQRFPELADEINNIAYLPAAEQDAALRAVVAEAKMTEKLIAMERPDYQAVGVDQDLVNVRDPAALRQFDARRNGGGQTGGYAEGQTATNPSTGQKIVFRNGAWRPM
jgi:hypothetical protein